MRTHKKTNDATEGKNISTDTIKSNVLHSNYPAEKTWKIVTHLMCTDNNILHVVFVLLYLPSPHLQDNLLHLTPAPEHSPPCHSDAQGNRGCGLYPGLNWLDSGFF